MTNAARAELEMAVFVDGMAVGSTSAGTKRLIHFPTGRQAAGVGTVKDLLNSGMDSVEIQL